MSKFPREKVSVVTILRDPIDRVFSTYEFSVDLAAKFLSYPNLEYVAKSAEAIQRIHNRTKTLSTLDVWPWNYLIPWIREDLFIRRDARKLSGLSHFNFNDPYDMKDFVIPLHEYIHDSLTRDLVHNGATFQIAGITNMSYSAESHEVRNCVLRYPSLGKLVLEIAKRRLDGMLYVGLTEKHRESAIMFSKMFGEQVISQRTKSNHIAELTVPKLMDVYERCSPDFRRAESELRKKTHEEEGPSNFSKMDREKVPKALIEEITSLNSLYIELYNHAKLIFAEYEEKMKSNSGSMENEAHSFEKEEL